MYTIKTPSGFLGYTESTYSRVSRIPKISRVPQQNIIHVPPKSYIIGFNKLVMAKYVVDKIKIPPQISMTKHNTYDITDDIIENLISLGIDLDYKNIGNVSIDTSARLRIEKEDILEDLKTIDYDDYNISIKLVNMDDFVFMPFENNIGIIMPYNIEHEDSECIIMTSSVIDPCNSVPKFRDSLKP